MGFVRAIETATPDVLGRRLDIAVKDPVTARDGLLQVLTHSSHPSQVLSWLAAHGVPTPDLTTCEARRAARSTLVLLA
jgi:hypothetical protein